MTTRSIHTSPAPQRRRSGQTPVIVSPNRGDSTPRVFHFAYMVPARHDPNSPRQQMPFPVRDAEAALNIQAVLFKRGYEFAGTIFNYPAERDAQTIIVDDSIFRPSDLLLLTTRPPLNDEDVPGRRYVHRSHTSLEDRVFDALRPGPFFEVCARSHIRLSKDLLRHSPRAVVEKRNIQFRVHGGASYDQYWCDGWHKPKHKNTTAAYMIFVAEAWPGGPQLLVVFGVGGTETLVWTHLLRTEFSHLVGRPGFVMAELITTDPPWWIHDMSFADDWKVELLTGPEPVVVPPKNVGMGGSR